MKRIAILTFHFTDNPGSVLQAYALQKVVENLGNDCQILNYQKENWDKESKRGYFNSLYKRYGALAYPAFLYRNTIQKRRMKLYTRFQKQYLNIYPYYPITRKDLYSIGKYDYYIVGSDQIWNFDNPKVDNTYLLDFVDDDSRKVAYAASFGTEKVKNCDSFKKYLAKFRHISVREYQGATIVKNLINRFSKVVIDHSLKAERDL